MQCTISILHWKLPVNAAFCIHRSLWTWRISVNELYHRSCSSPLTIVKNLVLSKILATALNRFCSLFLPHQPQLWRRTFFRLNNNTKLIFSDQNILLVRPLAWAFFKDKPTARIRGQTNKDLYTFPARIAQLVAHRLCTQICAIWGSNEISGRMIGNFGTLFYTNLKCKNCLGLAPK